MFSMDTDFIFKQVQHMRPSSFSVREQQRYRAEVSLITVTLNAKVCDCVQYGVSESADSFCLAENAHEAVYAHEAAP